MLPEEPDKILFCGKMLFGTYTGAQLQQEVRYIHVSQAGGQVECGHPAVVIPPRHLGSRNIDLEKWTKQEPISMSNILYRLPFIRKLWFYSNNSEEIYS